MTPSPPRRSQRRGFTLMELLVCTSFLAIAITVMLKMHQQRLDYDRNCMDRLCTQLEAENLAQSLQVMGYDEISDQVAELSAKQDVEIRVDPFESQSANGLHITILMESRMGPVVHHAWRMEPKS